MVARSTSAGGHCVSRSKANGAMTASEGALAVGFLGIRLWPRLIGVLFADPGFGGEAH